MAENTQTPVTSPLNNAGAGAGTGAGGFMVPALPSPAPSASSSMPSSGLPHPRRHSLRPGSVKEDKVRNYVAERLLHINRRYVKKFGMVEPGDKVVGYKSMAELCKDLDELINVIWLSGTPSLQIPYLLNIASEFNTWLPAFPPSRTATFSTLRKLDHCFASLLTGQDYETKEDLPGFENGLRSGMSRTDMVRCKSLVELTRVIIVDVMNKEPEDDEDVEEPEELLMSDDPESGVDGPAGRSSKWNWLDDDDEEFHMDVARVYEHTLVQLGEALGDGGGVGDIQISDD